MRFLQSIKARCVLWVWNHTPDCAEMSRLASRTLDEPISIKVRLKMWLHWFICVWCDRYYKHLKFLHHASTESLEHLERLSNHSLSADAKRRMVRRLHAAHHN